MKNYSDFKNNLKELRLKKKLSQEDLAKEIGVSQACIARWESGKQEPKFTYIIKLAIFFGVSSDYLLGLEF